MVTTKEWNVIYFNRSQQRPGWDVTSQDGRVYYGKVRSYRDGYWTVDCDGQSSGPFDSLQAAAESLIPP